MLRALKNLLGRRRLEAEMDEELREHVARLIERNLAAGMPAAEARRAALLRFGQLEGVKEVARAGRVGAGLGTGLRDLQHGARLLRRSPGFTLAVVTTLALGIGANTAMFSVVDGVLLRPLPYPRSEQLVQLMERGPGGSSPISYPNFVDWQAQQTSLQQMGIWRPVGFNLTGAGQPLRLSGMQASAGLLAALGVTPALGRLFTPEDDRPGAPPVVLLSHGFWTRQFGADPGVVGKTLTLDGRPWRVVGVLPAAFRFGGDRAVWEPIARSVPEWHTRLRRFGLRGIGRLKPGVTMASARLDLDTIAARLEQQHPDTNRGRRVQVDGLLDTEVAGSRRALWILLGAAAFVLAIACANVAGLLLARAVTRGKEMAVRAALGASRGRLIRQLSTESLLLAALGSAAGLLLARLALGGVLSVAGGRLPRAAEVALDGRVLVVSLLTTLLVAVGFGLLPALRASRTDPQDCLTRDGRTHTGRSRLRQGLLVGQVALTVTLLVGAGLLLRSFHRLQQVDPGFRPQQVVTFRLNLPERKYPTPHHALEFYRQLGERLRNLPGAQAASLSWSLPFDDRRSDACFGVVGRPTPRLNGCPSMEMDFVGPDYFRVLGIPVLRGRSFTADEDRPPPPGGPPGENWQGLRSVIIDEQFARRHFPGQDPVGQRIFWPWAPGQPVQTIVGVVGRVKLRNLRERGGEAQAYFPIAQAPLVPRLTAAIRTDLPPATVMAAVREQLRTLDPEQPTFDVRTLTQMRDRTLAAERLNLTLLGVFAAVAFALVLMGIYGLMAYQVAQNQREIGVRMALGAQRGQVLRQVVGQALCLAAAGIVLGIAGALALGRLLGTLLFEVRPLDPLALAGATGLVLVVALLASYVPARRAARLDPMAVLRHE